MSVALRHNRVQQGIVSAFRTVPRTINLPEYALSGMLPVQPREICLFSVDEIHRMKESAVLARRMLDFACSLVEVGITTDEIDALTHDEIIKNGAYPTPLNYAGFPKSICTSVNDVSCHGIPDNRHLMKGDIIAIDVSLYFNKFHGDNCGTVQVGVPANSPEEEPIIDVTRKAVQAAISAIGPGICLSTVGNTIDRLAKQHGYSVIPDFCGHGVGKQLHMQPIVMHNANKYKLQLRPNMIFTIEPILVEGSPEISVWNDGWTAVTKDGGWSAQFEHEVLITEHGTEILTLPN